MTTIAPAGVGVTKAEVTYSCNLDLTSIPRHILRRIDKLRRGSLSAHHHASLYPIKYESGRLKRVELEDYIAVWADNQEMANTAPGDVTTNDGCDGIVLHANDGVVVSLCLAGNGREESLASITVRGPLKHSRLSDNDVWDVFEGLVTSKESVYDE